MKRYLALGCFGIGLIVSPVLGGIGHAAVPANPKIGVVNFQETMLSTPAGKRASEAFENTRKAKQGQIDKQQEELKKADAELRKQQATLTPAVFDQRRADLEKKFLELQQTYAKLERELAQDRAKVLQDFSKLAEPKIAAIAKAEGITVILDRSATVWMDPAVDLTAKLNAEMK
jgi:outer membrane protein